MKLWRAEGIDDAAVPHFLAMDKLEVLELPETGVTTEGLLQLSEKSGLRRLLIGGVAGTPEQVEALRQALPDCHISWWKKPEIEYGGRSRRGG